MYTTSSVSFFLWIPPHTKLLVEPANVLPTHQCIRCLSISTTVTGPWSDSFSWSAPSDSWDSIQLFDLLVDLASNPPSFCLPGRGRVLFGSVLSSGSSTLVLGIEGLVKVMVVLSNVEFSRSGFNAYRDLTVSYEDSGKALTVLPHLFTPRLH